MNNSRSAALKRNIRIDCGKYLVRTIKGDDASDRWAAWTADPEMMNALNLPTAKLTKADIAAYVKRFDQWSHWLVGVFVKADSSHIGIIRIDVDYSAARCHINMLIGDPAYRNKGVTADVFVACLDYVFETVGLEKMTASILLRNQLSMRYLQKAGWKIEPAKVGQIVSRSDRSLLDVQTVALTGDAWRLWKKTETAARIMRRIKGAKGAALGK